MIVAAAIAEYLAKRGCTHAFGVVGGANLALFSEIAKKMQVVSVHHEQAASLSALYYYKTCGRIAPVLVTAGGGSANAITGVVEAYMDSIPLLVLSGNEMSKWFSRPHSRSIGFQGFDPTEAVSWCTKLAISVEKVSDALLDLDMCWQDAFEHRQGAVWLDIPQDIATSEDV